MRRSRLSKPGQTEPIEGVVCGSIVSDGSETALTGSICKTSINQIGMERPMSEDEVRRAPKSPKIYPAEKVRQGTVILRKRWQRIVFIAGLVGSVLLALFVSVRGSH
jgi:hypothetical protein